MSSIDFLLASRNSLPSHAWPWIINSLMRDRVVWDALVNTELGIRALDEFYGEQRFWSPASLAMMSMDFLVPIEKIQNPTVLPLEAAIREQVTGEFEVR